MKRAAHFHIKCHKAKEREARETAQSHITPGSAKNQSSIATQATNNTPDNECRLK